jgi:5-oxoprolinase (ATP-hydrolysing)
VRGLRRPGRLGALHGGAPPRGGSELSYRVGLDIGGTFTDLVLLEEGTDELELHKVLTTPSDPAVGALQGLEELLARRRLSLDSCSTLVHGTTLVTNAVIERRGAPTALLTTRGFRDILEMGKEQRYDIYDLFLSYPEPLVPRRWRLEVDERLTRDGESLRSPDLGQVRSLVAGLVEAGAQAVAVCFLHSYLEPGHEQAVAELIRAEFPALAVSASSEVVPEIREFERTSTTVCNAYVQPLVDRYLARLEAELQRRGFQGRFYLMQSSGGLCGPEVARRFPVRLLESGPAGGAIAGAYLGRRIGLADLVAFDMGGTTAKICLVLDRRPALAAEIEAGRVHRFKRGSGLPVKSPVLDLMEIGAGGGSIAFANRLGLLQVGPQSAGADPGPACYGRGGVDATVTDACLRLGYLDPRYFLGGTMALDVGAADRVLDQLGHALGLTTEAAWGVYSVVCEDMAAAARVHIIEKGHDPRRFPLMAFGGAGPLHAAHVARALGAAEVVVPPVSGVASALGFLVAPVSFEFSRSYPALLTRLPLDEISYLYADMEEQGVALLRSAGVEEAAVRLERSAEMRLAGQFHDIVVPVPAGRLNADSAAELGRFFRAEYERLYHAVLPGYEPQVLNWRLRAFGPEPEVTFPSLAAIAADGALRGRRPAYFPEAGAYVETPVFDRYRLHAGEQIPGPAIIEERESTTVLGPADDLEVDGSGNLRLKVGRR